MRAAGERVGYLGGARPRGLLTAGGQGDAAAVQIEEVAAVAAKPHHPLHRVAERRRGRCGDEHSVCGRVARRVVGCGVLGATVSSTSRSWIHESQKR